MSVNVLLRLLGPEEVAMYSRAELDALSEALIREIEQDPVVARRLLIAIDRSQTSLQTAPAATQQG